MFLAATQVVQRFGASCHLPGSFQAPLAVVLYNGSYEEAVRANILAGGDQASRAYSVGAITAAQGGLGAIPVAWRERTKELPNVEALLETVLDQRFGQVEKPPYS
jgi:ADP-ribosylglycohydrolase